MEAKSQWGARLEASAFSLAWAVSAGSLLQGSNNQGGGTQQLKGEREKVTISHYNKITC